MGGGVGFFCGASNRLPTSDFLSPISLAPWLLGSLAPRPSPSPKSWLKTAIAVDLKRSTIFFNDVFDRVRPRWEETC